MRKFTQYFSRFTEGMAALMMAAMFATFILQIAVRYIVGSDWFITNFAGSSVTASDFGWTLEFCLVLWVWIVFWGNSFIVRDRDHVKFDIFYLASPPKIRRILALVSSAVVAVTLYLSVMPTFDKFWILRLKSSATLGIKMLPIYSIFLFFLVAVATRYAWRFYQAYRHGVANETEENSVEETKE